MLLGKLRGWGWVSESRPPLVDAIPLPPLPTRRLPAGSYLPRRLARPRSARGLVEVWAVSLPLPALARLCLGNRGRVCPTLDRQDAQEQRRHEPWFIPIQKGRRPLPKSP